MTRASVAAAAILFALFRTPAPAAAQDRIVMCSGQPVPRGYAVVEGARRQQCPGFWDGTINSYTIVLPGDTVTVCSEQTPQLPGYVETARYRMQQCTRFWDGIANTIVFRRVAGGYGDRSRPPEPPALDRLSESERFVARQLARAEDGLGLDAPTHRPWNASLRGGESVTTRLDLTPGERYTLVAVCERECGNLDLRVVDAAGRVLAEDADPDAEPFLHLPPASAGAWDVVVTMRRCDAARCRFALAIHRSPPPPPPAPPAPPPARPEAPGVTRPTPPTPPGGTRVVPPTP